MFKSKNKVSNEKPIDEEIKSESFENPIDNDEVMEEGVEEDEPKKKEEIKEFAQIRSQELLPNGILQSVIISNFQFGTIGKTYQKFNLD